MAIKIQWELKLCNEISELFFSLEKFTFFEELERIVECPRLKGGDKLGEGRLVQSKSKTRDIARKKADKHRT